MPGASAFNRRFNTMPGKTGSVGASVKKRKPTKKPMAPPPVPASGRVNRFERVGPVNPFPAKRGSSGRPNPFATKRGSK